MLHCLFAKREDGGVCEKRNVIQSNRWRLNNKFTRSYPKSLRELHNSKSRVLSDQFFALLQSPKFLVSKRINGVFAIGGCSGLNYFRSPLYKCILTENRNLTLGPMTTGVKGRGGKVRGR